MPGGPGMCRVDDRTGRGGRRSPQFALRYEPIVEGDCRAGNKSETFTRRFCRTSTAFVRFPKLPRRL